MYTTSIRHSVAYVACVASVSIGYVRKISVMRVDVGELSAQDVLRKGWGESKKREEGGVERERIKFYSCFTNLVQSET